ncbi:MAG: ShlB/FhaC/HecB family hemolysin secretion/activation protein [Parachlamydiales bacterium]
MFLPAAPPPVPSGGVIERELEKEYEAEPLEPERRLPEIEIEVPKEQLKIPAGLKVKISGLEIRGNEALASREIKKRLQQSFGSFDRALSIGEIYELCRQIEIFYAEKGFFLARAFPPPQKIEKGLLVIEVLEGKLGRLKIIGNKHYREAFILQYFAPFKNRAINYDQFLRALMLLNENSDLVAGALLEKGQEVGRVDLVIRVQDKYPAHLYLNGNNYGRLLTTSARVGARLDSRLFVDGDKFSVAEVIGFPVSALYFTDFSYRFPVNARGTFWELSYLTSRFHIQELKDLHLKGRSDIATLKVTHALRRGRFLNADIFAYFDYKQIKNYTLGRVTSFDKLRPLTFGVNLDHFSLKLGRNFLILRTAFGLPGFLGGLKDPSAISSRSGAHGKFVKLNLDYDCLRKLTYDMFFFLHSSGQWSPNRLTVPEQIYIGGADTVRGFSLASAMGDSGYYFNFEWRFPFFGLKDVSFFGAKKKWKEILQFSAFLDQGGVFSKGNSHKFETGAGLGVRLNAFWSLAVTFEAGFPLNHRETNRKAFFYLKITGQPF